MRSHIISALVLGCAALAGTARADVISVTYGAAGVQTAPAVVVANATTIGTETFDQRASGGFTTDFNTGGVITGTYSAGASINAANLYGGAGGTGSYVQAIGFGNGYTISLATQGVPGVNYFGYWLSALDAGNQIVFKRAGAVVGTYQPSDLIAALGDCSGSNPYCGNPTANFRGQDPGEQFAFVSFVDRTGFFDEIDMFEKPNFGNYESDNHTVAYCANATACVTGVSVPEPLSLALLAGGLAALGVVRRARRG